MRPAENIAENIEAMVRKTGCKAPEEMRRRLWSNIADQLHESQAMRERRGKPRVWRILMNSKIARLAVTAVVVLAALAVGVERLTRTKPDQVQAFSAQIRTDMALDLDPEAALPLRNTRPEDFDVTWSSEDGGSLKILPGSSLRIWAITLINLEWDSVIGWAFSHLADIRESDVTSIVPTKKTPFAAVLTSEGNLAVIKIGGYNEEHAWLSWRVEKAVSPGYSPIEIRTLRSVDVQSVAGEDGGVDLDTGRVVSIPADVLSMPAAEMLRWLEQNGVDAIAKQTEEGYGLIGVGLVFWTWSPGSWTDRAVDLREEMASASFQPRRPLLYQEGQYQYVFPFKTREGGIGMLQMLAVDKSKRRIQFRYRVVQTEDNTPSETENDAESQRLSASVTKLMRFGLLAWNYADEHDGHFPETLQQFKAYAERFNQDFQWIRDNVGYVGAGGTTDDPNPGETLLAYDKSLLATGKGTYVVFNDGHAAFIEPERLPQYGLPTAGSTPESQRLAESVDRLMRFAIVLMRYAQRHGGALPDTLGELEEYVRECGQDYQWIAENVGYLGKGARMVADPSVPVAYDKTLAARGKGTYVLYSEACVAFWGPKELQERSILEPTESLRR